jgi:hypothetical protein
MSHPLVSLLACASFALLALACSSVGTGTKPSESSTDGRMSAEELVDFIDNTPMFKGKTLTIRLTVGELGTIRDLAGKEARFFTFTNTGARYDMIVKLPTGEDVPDSTYGDKVLVTFVCEDGDRKHGNVAKMIVRAQE